MYKKLSDANRRSSYPTPPSGPALCDDQLPEEWYCFVRAVGTKMLTTRVPAFRCGRDWSGWLDGAHPTVEDGEVRRKVCFSDQFSGCRYSNNIYVKNCGIFQFFFSFNRVMKKSCVVQH